ncbi:MAG: hypothetical protein ACYS7Y_11770 [Planctomycetota bacterium]|jgi:hypothetical protein
MTTLLNEHVAEWLNSLPGIEDASPITLTIRGKTWEGAVYTQRDIRRYCLVGARPKCHSRSSRVCFRLHGDDRDWYVASYLKDYDDLTEAQKVHHPFGQTWFMMPWNSPGKIDDGMRKYTRVEATVE